MGHGSGNFDKKYYKRFFDKYSKDEFDMYCNWAEGWINFLGRYFPLKEGGGRNVLEIGSSLGYFSNILVRHGFKVVVSDVSSYIIEKAKKFQPDLDFMIVDIENEVKLRQKFDYIVGFEVLEHLKNPQKALSNIYSLLKKDGTLIFSTPFPSKRSLSDPTHINVHEKSWWLIAGRRADFKKMKVVYATFIPFLYRINKAFSIGFPIKTNIPFINSTAFYIFQK